MKNIFLCLLMLFTITSCNYKSKDVSVSALNYIVIEQSTNKILEGNNYDVSKSVASISKIMTAIVVIENTDINKEVIVPKEINQATGSSIYLKENQKVSVLDLLYGLMLRSGNDAAITLAISTSGSISKFVELMNNKAIELNLTESYFNNPHGLDENDNGNISSAKDMAMLYSYCLNNPLFSKIVSSKSYKGFVNKNRLLNTYEYCTGGKTGFTKKAKRTLITSASKNNIDLIVVTLNCGNDFATHKNLYEYYFNNYKSIKILNKGENSFDNYSFNCNKDYYFLTNEDNLNLYYFINYKNKYVEVYLYNKDNRIIDYIKIYINE